MWSDIPGWYNFGDIYQSWVDSAKSGDTIVEVGTAFGRSAAHLARMVIDSKKDIRIVCVDPWQTEPKRDGERTDADQMGWNGRYAHLWTEFGDTFGVFCGLMLRHAPEEFNRLTVCRLYSVEAAELPLGGSHGVFIDANHSLEGVREDIKAWGPLAKNLAGHDHSEVDFPGVVQACREAFGPEGYRVQGTSWVRL